MIFYKIKFVFLILFFVTETAFANVKVENMILNDVASYGIKKTLPFTSWGELPFDVLMSITQELGKQKKSYQLARMTADVLGQKTLLGNSHFTQEQAKIWLATRVRTLMDMGFYDDALALIEALPNSDKTSEVLALKADGYLLKDDFENACNLANVNKSKSDYFNRLNVMCLAFSDTKEKAMIAFDVWSEKNKNVDAFSYAMNNFFGLSQGSLADDVKLTVLDVYLMKALKLSYALKNTPLPYQIIEQQKTTPFKNAVNVEKLIERWEKQNLSKEEQTYKLYLLDTYADLFRGDLRLIRKRAIWKMPTTAQNYSPYSLWLSDKPENQVSGGDLLLSLWILSNRNMGADKAMRILNKGGFDMEPFVLEQLN